MTQFERSIDLATDADAAFELLADVRNLPRYFDAITSAEPVDGGHAVHVTAAVGGAPRDSDAWFEADQASRTIRWGSEGDNQYHGELTIAPSPDRSTGAGSQGDEDLALVVRLTTARSANDGEI